MKGLSRLLLLMGAALLLAGCKIDLYSNLSETDANQMLALLASNQIDGARRSDKSSGLVLQVEKKDFVKAVEVLRQNGYPRRVYRAVDDLFPSGQLVSSPAQEQAKIRFLREQSLERMLSNIEGVISANVVIADGQEEGNGTQGGEPSASVLVKYSPEVNLRALSAQLKNLIGNALPGVSQKRISLIVQSVDYRFVTAGQAVQETPVLPQPDNVSPPPVDAINTAMGEMKSTSTSEVDAKKMVVEQSAPALPASTVESIDAAMIPLWPLFLFWGVGVIGITWHGQHKAKLRRRTMVGDDRSAG
ncbi:MAG TPA: type III secretion inner membrane ring lipoprotein SctJ [Buttiauxella sp.]|jgi:type III secretion protein J